MKIALTTTLANDDPYLRISTHLLPIIVCNCEQFERQFRDRKNQFKTQFSNKLHTKKIILYLSEKNNNNINTGRRVEQQKLFRLILSRMLTDSEQLVVIFVICVRFGAVAVSDS